MHARVPQDVDLDDRLLFGLTAVRFGELALACLAAVAAWRLLPFAGGVVAAVIVAGGVAIAWGGWRGRGFDHWAVALVRFIVRTHRVELREDRWRWRPPPSLPSAARMRRALRVLDGNAE